VLTKKYVWTDQLPMAFRPRILDPLSHQSRPWTSQSRTGMGNHFQASFPDPQPVRHPVNGIEPARDQVDLQDAPVIEPYLAELVEILRGDAVSLPGQLDHVIQHGPVLVRKPGLGVILPQRGGEFLIQADPAEELGVAFHSVKTAVERRYQRRNHLVLAA